MSTSIGAEGDPRPTLTQYAVASAAVAADSLRQVTRGTARVARRLGRRGTEAVADRRDQVTSVVRGATDATFDWIASAVAPQLVDRMIPYISREAAPKIVDQMLPYISTDVAPKLIEQLLPHISDDVAPKLIDQLMPRLTQEVAPRLVEQLTPYLTQEAVPKIIDGSLPYIRDAVLPVIIEDLTHDPEVREMIAEQGRGVLTDATLELRETSATADDKIESGLRRLLHMPQAQS